MCPLERAVVVYFYFLHFSAMREKVLKALKEIKDERDAQIKRIQRLESAMELYPRPPVGLSLNSSVLDLLPLTTHSCLQELERLLRDDCNRGGLVGAKADKC